MFSLDGVSIKDYGLKITGGDIYPIPGVRERTATVTGQDGEYDFGGDFDTRPFEWELKYINSERLHLLRDMKAFMGALLDERGKPKSVKLVYDEEPDKQYWVKYNGGTRLDLLLHQVKFTLPMKAHKPLSEFVMETRNFVMGDDYPMVSDIRADRDYEFDVTSDTILLIDNFGTVGMRPLIEINGSADDLTLSANGKSLSYGDFSGTLLIDCNRWIVKENGTADLSKFSGDFIELYTGDNNVDVNGTNLDINIHFRLQPKYL